MPAAGWKKPVDYEWGTGSRAKDPKAARERSAKHKARTALPKPLYINNEVAAATNPELAAADEAEAVTAEGGAQKKRTRAQRAAANAPARAGTLDATEVNTMSAATEAEMTDDVAGAGGGVVHDDETEKPKDVSASRKKRRVTELDIEDGLEAPEEVSTADPQGDEARDVAARLALPLLEVSLTLARRQAHVLPGWLDAVYRFIMDYCEAGGVSLERGKKNEWLHCQVILRLHWDPAALDKIKMLIKNYAGIERGDGLHAVCELHVFREGQDWVGYIFKDRAKPHFKNKVHNIPEAVIAEGIQRWTQAALSYEDGKTVMTKAATLKAAHAFRATNINLAGASLLETLTSMLNGRAYLPSTGYLNGAGGVLRYDAAELYWRCIHGEVLTEAEVQTIFFAPDYTRPSRPGARPADENRYYYPEAPAADDVSAEPPLTATEGFLTGAKPTPMPAATRAGLSAFTQRLIARGTAAKSAAVPAEEDEEELSSDEAGLTSTALGPDSPRSPEGSRHASDDEWLDDDEVEDDPTMTAQVQFMRHGAAL